MLEMLSESDCARFYTSWSRHLDTDGLRERPSQANAAQKLHLKTVNNRGRQI